ncbi:MAG: hypothetical protein CSB47_11605 [Proteobacteria bacterium]|nr:MAG: hypothetical protein CSB47_11605 [Pseudomonadota bacterium]
MPDWPSWDDVKEGYSVIVAAQKKVGGYVVEGSKQAAGVVVGLGEHVYEFAESTVVSAAGAARTLYDLGPSGRIVDYIYEGTTPPAGLPSYARGKESINSAVDAAKFVWDNPGTLIDVYTDPIIADWRAGNYGEAVGRGLGTGIEAAGMFVSGGTLAAAKLGSSASKLGKLAAALRRPKLIGAMLSSAKMGGKNFLGKLDEILAAQPLDNVISGARQGDVLSDVLQSGKLSQKQLDDLLARGKITPEEHVAAKAKGRAGTDGAMVEGGGEAGGGKNKNPATEEANPVEKGEPVVVRTGEFVFNYHLFQLPTTLPISLSLNYKSLSTLETEAFGPKYASSWDQYLEAGFYDLTYHDAQGTKIHFNYPEPDGVALSNNKHRHLKLRWFLVDDEEPGSRTARQYQLTCGLLTYQFTVFKPGRYELTRVSDHNQNYINFQRTVSGQLKEIHHSDGIRLSCEYNAAGRRIAVYLHNQHDPEDEDRATRELLAAFSYHASGYLAACNNPNGSSRQWVYNEHGYLTDWRDSDQTRAQLKLDEKGRVVRILTSGAYHNHTFTYDEANRYTTYTTEDGKEWSRSYFDEAGNHIAEENAIGEITRYEYNEGGYLLAEIDPLGRRSEYERDDEGRVLAVILADGGQTRYEYSVAGYLTAVTDPGGNRWSYDYDSRGNLISAVDPTGIITELAYDTRGNLVRHSDAQGQGIEYHYDERQRLVGITDPVGNHTRLARDEWSRVTLVTDAKGQQTRFVYAKQVGRPFYAPSHIHYADGSVVERQWNSEGLLVSQQDPKGQQIHYQYGPFDQLLAVIDPLGNKLQLHYDSLERLSHVTNALGEQWTFQRNSAGRVVKETDFAGRTTQLAHDAAGQLVACQHSDGQLTRYRYDMVGRLVWQGHYPKTCNAAQQRQFDPAQYSDVLLSESHFSYDTRGLLQTVRNLHSEINFKRDAAGRVVEEIQNGYTLRHTHDPVSGRRQLLELPSGAETRFSYGPLGQLLAARLSDHESLRFSYDERGQEISRHTQQGFQLQQHWDALGQLQQQFSSDYSALHPAAPHPPANTAIRRDYQYDSLGQVTQIIDQHLGRQDYQYTATGQVTAAQHGHSNEHYDYDTAQNIRSSAQLGISATETGHQQHPVTHIADWVSQAGGAVRQQTTRGGSVANDYTYDTRGRLIKKTTYPQGFQPQTTRYQWDADDRLIKLETPKGQRYRYTYDALGRRIGKTCETDLRSTTYLWDGATMVEEVPVYADGTPAWEQATTWHYQPDSFVPLAKQTHEDEQLYYIVTDHLGTPREMVQEDGTPVWRQRYSVWGKPLLDQPQQAANDSLHPPDCAIRFQGQYQDSESGLYYNYQRYYDPDSAQYMTPDPIGLLGGMRPQGYVHNPNGWVDPLGLAGCPDAPKNDVTKSAKSGEFNIIDWEGYPDGVPKPTGPMRLIEGAEYDAARKAANSANRKIRRDNNLVGQQVDVHEVLPVKFGGSPTDPANKIIIDRSLHRQKVTPWWNQLQKDVGG